MRLIIGSQIFVLILLISNACTNSSNVSNEKTTPQIQASELHSIIDSTDIFLDIGTNNFQIVSLETSGSSLIGDGVKDIIVTDDYILIDNKQGLLQFNRKGKFIRQIMRKGKGPNEFLYIMSPAANNKYLYFHDMSKKRNRISKCDLETGIIYNFPLAIEGKIYDLAILEDSTMVVVNYSARELGLLTQLFVQDTLGTLLFQEKMGDYWELNSKIMLTQGFSRIQKFNNGTVIIESPYCDSLMLLADNQLNSIFYIRNLPRIDLNKLYDDFLKLNFIHYSKERLLLDRNFISVTKRRTKNFDSRLVLIELENLNPSVVKSFQIPEFNFKIDPMVVSFENKTIGVAEYSALDFKEKIKSALQDGNLAIEKQKTLKEMDENLTENDNPILIIWDL